MAIRVFTCRHCDHRMRLGAAHCGNCGSAAPVMNILLMFLGFVFAALVISLMGTILLSG